MSEDQFLGVHYRVNVAFKQRKVNCFPPNIEEVRKLMNELEEEALVTEEQWCKQFVKDYVQGNEKHKLIQRKPAVMNWRAWYLKCMHVDVSIGDVLQRRWRQWMKEMAWEELSDLQRLCFEGSLHIIEPMIKESKVNPFLNEKSVLFYAVLSRSVETLTFLLENGLDSKLEEGECWTGFTALHLALFTQHREMISLLWNKYKFNVKKKDWFFGSVLDYAKLLGNVCNVEVYEKGKRDLGYGYGYTCFEHMVQVVMEQEQSRNVDCVYFSYFNKKTKEVEKMPLSEWNDLVHCVYQPFITAKDSYLDELMFNGVFVEKIDVENVRKYKTFLDNSNWYESVNNDVMMCYINANIGFGCYASKELKSGDFVVKYTGRLHSDRYKWKDVEKTTEFRLNFMKQIHDLGEKGKDIIKKQPIPRYKRDPVFNLPVSNSSYFLNCQESGGMNRIINHSNDPNAEVLTFWNCGIPISIIVATKEIRKGEQILIDYRQHFWKHFDEKTDHISKKEERVSLWNYDEQGSLIAKERRDFFKPSDVIEMREYDKFPNKLY